LGLAYHKAKQQALVLNYPEGKSKTTNHTNPNPARSQLDDSIHQMLDAGAGAGTPKVQPKACTAGWGNTKVICPVMG